jgi:hypothetical protein
MNAMSKFSSALAMIRIMAIIAPAAVMQKPKELYDEKIGFADLSNIFTMVQNPSPMIGAMDPLPIQSKLTAY